MQYMYIVNMIIPKTFYLFIINLIFNFEFGYSVFSLNKILYLILLMQNNLQLCMLYISNITIIIII